MGRGEARFGTDGILRPALHNIEPCSRRGILSFHIPKGLSWQKGSEGFRREKKCGLSKVSERGRGPGDLVRVEPF